MFVKYNYDESVGCEHYIRGCQVKCKTCGQFFPCRLCHDDVCDHEFPRYETTEVKCNYCGNEQPFAQYCKKCGKCFGSYYCEKCRLICDMGPDAKPNYHCDGCKMCMVGIREFSKHCYKCGGCYNIDYFDRHKCIAERSECIVCLGDMVKTIYGRITLNCGHQMHIHCYQELLDKGIYKCPVCKKFLPTDSDREWIVKSQKRIYQGIFLSPKIMGHVVLVKCNDCLREFPQQRHVYYQYCPWCDLFNVEVMGPVKSM